jgi:hypothetical protein
LRKTVRWYACSARSAPGGPSQSSTAVRAAAEAAERIASRLRGVALVTAAA